MPQSPGGSSGGCYRYVGSKGQMEGQQSAPIALASAGTGHCMAAPLRHRSAAHSRTVSTALLPFFMVWQYLQAVHQSGHSPLKA